MPHTSSSFLARFSPWNKTKQQDRRIRTASIVTEAKSAILPYNTPCLDAIDASSVSIDHGHRLLHEGQQGETNLADVSDASSIQQFPVEILGEIFRHCLLTSRADGFFADYITPDQSQAPLLLCRVCAYWRQVAISTPVLWSKFSAQRSCGLPSHWQLIQLWLNRSQSHPLSFHISQQSASEKGNLPHTHRIMKLFLPHFSRCYDLHISLDDTLARELFSIPAEDKTSLNSLALDTNICSRGVIDQIPDIINSFTNIRQLSFSIYRPPISLAKISWSQLTHVELYYFFLPIDVMSVILAQCSQVVEFVSDRLKPSVGYSFPTTVLPHLHTLRISCRCTPLSQCCIGELLQCFTLPALRSLRLIIHHPSHFAHWEPEWFIAFLARSCCQLEVLTLYYRELFEDTIIAYLQTPLLKHLKEITLSSIHVSDRTLVLLTYPSSGTDGGILPCLESISLSGCTPSDGLLADMVASRWVPIRSARNHTHPVSLKYVDGQFHKPFGVPRPCPAQDKSRLLAFHAEGLKLGFTLRLHLLYTCYVS
jgi:hypothetical protein